MLSGASTRNPMFSHRANRLGEQPIADLMTQALARPELISLAAGFVDNESLPVDIAADVVRDFLSDPQQAQASLQYGSNAGDPQLRAAILDRWYDTAEGFSVDQVVISAGSNQLLYLLTDILLDPGDIILCASPTYLVFLGIMDAIGGRAIGIETDQQGMVPESLTEQLQLLQESGDLHRVKAIYLVPYHDNPAARTMAWERKSQIAEIAQHWSNENPIYVLMDSAYQELHYCGEPTPRLLASETDPELLVEIGTFSKCFSPGLRVGWAVLPESLLDPLLGIKGYFDFGAPNFAQQLARGVLASGRLDPHLSGLRHQYLRKRDTMLSALEEHLSGHPGVHWETPNGGLYVWLHLPNGMTAGPEGELLQHSLEEGVLYVPGQYCFPKEGAGVEENTIRLSFGVQSSERIEAGIAALGRAIRRA